MSETINRFNIRVYGILLNGDDEVLLVNETIRGFSFTKFPGGGLEFGEGIAGCLEREFMEELNLQTEIIKHFYTTDFFQQSAFRKTDQLISIYYLVRSKFPDYEINLQEQTEFLNEDCDKRQFFWKKRKELHAEMLTFPVDKLVCGMLNSPDFNLKVRV
jgi:8-oxo-dGTP diphosphatase